jgi:hypothetical protein
MTELPQLLRTPLPASASATKQEYNAELNRRWLTVWTNSPRKNRFSQIDPNFPFKKFRKKSYNLTRKQTSLIMQVRTGHIPLNFYLHRIGKTDTDRCAKCINNQHGASAKESVNHFIFDCPAYDEYRQELTAKIGRSHLNFPSIMSNTDHMKALVTFINRTRRFDEAS